MKSKIERVTAIKESISKRTTKPAIPIGIEALDNLTWGLHKKELMTVLGRPSCGKTAMLLNMAWGVAKHGTPAIFCSLEMSVEAIIERLLCIEFGIHGWKLRTGDVNEIRRALSHADAFISTFLPMQFEIYDDVGKTIQSVEDILKEMRPEVLFIDYLQKISTRGHASRYEALTDYVVKLQSFAIQYDCAIVLASQINRGGAGQDDAGNFAKGTGEVEESSDCMLQCSWPYKTDPDADRRDFIVRANKQRHGPCSSVNLNFEAEFFRFSDKKFEEKAGHKNWMDGVD